MASQFQLTSPFKSIARERVTESQPPKNGSELDVDRCAVLHNTIAIYGWITRGKRIADMDKRPWWRKHGSGILQAHLRPSVVRFLQRVYDLPGNNFFYYVSGLASPKQMAFLGDLLDDEDRKQPDKHRFITLYMTSPDLVKSPAGIIYDQDRHQALFMPTFNHIYDLENQNLPWQRLESILSAYVDLVEAQKVIAFHSSSATRFRYNTAPWTIMPYTHSDLINCLDMWEHLYETIEKRAGLPPVDEDDEDYAPLCGRSALGAAHIPKGFASDLFSNARNPQIWYIAPGIRLPGASEFVNQPFKQVMDKYPEETKNIKMPILFFRCDGSVSSKEAKFRYPFSTVERVPCGLYLDAQPNAENPFEDACRLVLPFPLGANKYARMSDGKIVPRSHVDLYGHGISPFILRHGPKLSAILESWLLNVESGHWNVDAQGVSGGVEVFKQADTREHWWRYQLPEIRSI